MSQTKIETIIATMSGYQMSPFVAGPVYSGWMFRINSALINQVSRLVKFPDAGGIEHTPWEQEIDSDQKKLIADLIGLRNIVVDAIDSLEDGYPPSTIADTYNWMLRANPEENKLRIKQDMAREYLTRKKAGEKLHSTVAQYVEDGYNQQVRSYSALVDTREQVEHYLEEAIFVKSRSDDPMGYSNLPEWVDEMAQMVLEDKFTTSYVKKLVMLDRKLSKNTRLAVETELALMEAAATDLHVDLPEQGATAEFTAADKALMKELGLELDDPIPQD